MFVFFYAQTAQQCGCVAFGIPSLKFGKLFLKFGRSYTVLICKVGLCIYGILFLDDIPKHGMALKYGIHNGKFVKFEVVLFEYRHAFSGALGHVAMR